MVGVGMIVALLPRRVMDLSGSLTGASYVASAFAISYLAVQMPVGRLADRIGVKPFLIAGYGLCCLSGLLYVGASSANALFLGRFVQGAGEAPVWALAPALLSITYPAAKGRMIGVYNASIHLGLTAGPLLGVLAFPTGQGQGPFLVFAGLCFAGAMVTLTVLPAKNESSGQLVQNFQLKDFLGLMRNRACGVTLFGVLLFGAGYGTLISVVPAYLGKSRGLDHVEISLFFTLFYIAISVSQLIVGPLSDRYGRHGFMIGGMVLSCIGFAAIPSASQSLIYVPVGIASLGLGVFCVASMAYLNERVPGHMKATVTGAFYLFWGGGYFAGPLMVGALSAAVGICWAHYMLAASMGVQALLQAVCRRQGAAAE